MRKIVAIFLVVAVGITAWVWLTLRQNEQRYDESKSAAVARQKWGDVCGPTEPTIKVENLPGDRRGEARRQVLDSPAGRIWVKCEIALDPSVSGGNGPLACSVLVHEYGHLAGFRDPSNEKDPAHSDDPDSIMYHRITSRNVAPGCR